MRVSHNGPYTSTLEHKRCTNHDRRAKVLRLGRFPPLFFIYLAPIYLFTCDVLWAHKSIWYTCIEILSTPYFLLFSFIIFFSFMHRMFYLDCIRWTKTKKMHVVVVINSFFLGWMLSCMYCTMILQQRARDERFKKEGTNNLKKNSSRVWRQRYSWIEVR